LGIVLAWRRLISPSSLLLSDGLKLISMLSRQSSSRRRTASWGRPAKVGRVGVKALI
jgi:hypothetical protein